ncbi:SixA phosphatase family protein [Kiloniella laminariae]|uniref:SixA phosphatase family protein n=1 Tax=Kiloniella laminariae TaxID=454162 RepID=UPI0003A4CA0F|nr:histidine phosphatase family protein [Kiloniella laminariae]
MKTIFITRHASTRSAQRGQEDIDRELTRKGETEAAWLGEHLRVHNDIPSLILVSAANRARETAILIRETLMPELPIQTEDQLYLAPSAQILKTLHSLPEDINSVLLVGHNPGLSDFLLKATNQSGLNTETRNRLYRGLPPAALARLTSTAREWTDILQNNTRIEQISYPGE